MKIFSKDVFLKSEGYLKNRELYEKGNLPEGVEEWYIQCDGKTQEECHDLGFLICDEWLVDKNGK